MTYVERLKQIEGEDIWEKLEGDLGPPKDLTVYTSSMLDLYTKCPYKYYLKRIVGAKPVQRTLGAVVGTAIHWAARELHTNKKWRDWQDIFQEKWDGVLNSLEEKDLPWSSSTSDPDKGFGEGVELLSHYIAKNQHANVWAVEIPFRCVVKHPKTGTRYRLAGTMDQIRFGALDPTRNGIHGLSSQIWDLKSGKTVPSPAFLANAIQPTSYMYGAQNGVVIHPEYGSQQLSPHHFIWYHLRNLIPYKRAVKSKGKVAGDSRGDAEIEVHRSGAEVDAFAKQMCNIVRGIRMGIWFKNDSILGGCDMCDMKQACTEGVFMEKEDAVKMAEMPGEEGDVR